MNSVGDAGGPQLEYHFSKSLLMLAGNEHCSKLEEELRIQAIGHTCFEHILFFRVFPGYIPPRTP